MLAQLSAGVLARSLAQGGAGWLAPALLTARGYATRVSRGLLFEQHGAPERVLRLHESTLPPEGELGDHEVLLHILAVSWALLREAQASCQAQEAMQGS